MTPLQIETQDLLINRILSLKWKTTTFISCTVEQFEDVLGLPRFAGPCPGVGLSTYNRILGLLGVGDLASQ
jgi:hypothetical protein